MFFAHFDRILYSLLPAEEIRMFSAQDLLNVPDDEKRAAARADHAYGTVALPGLEQWKDSPEKYDEQRAAVRERLASRLLAEAVYREGRFVRDIAAWLYALLSEPSWSYSNARHVPSRADRPDAFCAGTAELVIWTCRVLGDDIERYAPGICDMAMNECADRLLGFIDDPQLLEAISRRPDTLRFAASAVTAVLLVPQDESVRWLRLKNILRMADKCLAEGRLGDVYRHSGLAAWLDDALCLTDIAFMCDIACSGGTCLRADDDIRAQTALIRSAYICSDHFLDSRSYLKPDICGADIYRLGAELDDDDICSIACAVEGLHQSARGSGGITGRILNLLWSGSFAGDRAGGASPLPQTVCDEKYGMLAARPRDKGFYAGMYFGSLVLFHDKLPVLVMGPSSGTRSVPWPEGTTSVTNNQSDISAREEGFPTLSLNMAGAFNKETCVSSWQRTVMLTSGAANVRLVDAFDFAGARRRASLRFITPICPVVAVGAPRAAIGDCLIEWDGPAAASVEPVECGGQELYALVLTSSGPSAGGCWTCFFSGIK